MACASVSLEISQMFFCCSQDLKLLRGDNYWAWVQPGGALQPHERLKVIDQTDTLKMAQVGSLSLETTWGPEQNG